MRTAALTVLLAVVLRVVLGPGSIGYDASWALEWGREAASGALPDLEAPGAPTPHPLPNLVSVFLAPLGMRSADAVMAISWLSLGALALVSYRLGARLYSPWVGGAFAAILVTRGLIVRETQQAIIDIPFLALILAALAAEAHRPREGLRVPLLLLAAGLLRPEAWLLGAAWLIWAAPRGALLRPALIVAAAPVLWCLHDLVLTGDPLHSLHGTQELAAELRRPTEVDTAIAAIPVYLRFALGDTVFWLGLAGAAGGLLWRQERSLLPGVLTGLGLAGFLVLGVAGLPLLIRYLLLPAALLALFAALAAFGWSTTTAGDPERRWWIAAGAVACGLLAVTIPGRVGDLADLREASRPRIAAYEDLRELADLPAVRAASARCGAITIPDPRPRPLLAVWLDRSPASMTVRDRDDALVLAYANDDAARSFSLGPAGAVGLPPDAAPVARNGSWLLGARC